MQCNPSVKQCKRQPSERQNIAHFLNRFSLVSNNGSLEHAKFQIKILLPSDSNIDTKTSNLFTNNSNVGTNNCYKKHRYKTIRNAATVWSILNLTTIIMRNQLKYKYSRKSMNEKVKALYHLQDSLSNKEVTKKQNVPKSTLSTWLNNKGKIPKA